MVKVFISSNCQSGPLAAAWKAMRPDDEVYGCAVHTLIEKPIEIRMAQTRAEIADIVLYNPIADDYPVEFARSHNMRSLPGIDKVAIPMMFFEGLHPDLCYLGGPGNRISTIMGDYHSRIVLRSFLMGRTTEETLRIFSDQEMYEELGYFDKFDSSLRELENRDKNCDIPGRPILEKLVRDLPTLFTVNHPTNRLMAELVIESFKALQLPFTAIDEEFIPQTLAGGPIWPIHECVKERHRLLYKSLSVMKTNEGGERFISFKDFIEKSYFIYTSKICNVLEAPQAQQQLSILGLDGTLDLHRKIIEGVQFRRTFIPKDRNITFNIENPQHVLFGKLVELEDQNPEQPRDTIDAVWEHPGEPTALLKLAKFAIDSGNTAHGLRFYELALASDVCAIDAYEDAVIAALSVGRKDISDKFVQFLMSRKEKNGKFYRALAKCSRIVGDTATAILAACKAVESGGDQIEGMTLLGHILMDAAQPSMAISTMEFLCERYGADPHHLALIGRAQMLLRNFKGAEKSLRHAFRLDGRNEGILNGYFEALAALGDRDACIGLCEIAIENFPHNDAWVTRRAALAEAN